MLFGKKKAQKNICVLLDSATSSVLARGTMDGPPEGLNVQVNIIEGNAQAVINAEHVQIVPADEAQPPRLGHVIHRQGNLLVLEPLRVLTGEKVRENLRMPVDFSTFVYPTDGRKGRFRAQANDLSCGGFSFYCDDVFQVGDTVEIVIPITRVAPLLLRCQVLRKNLETDGSFFYAVKHLNLLSEQESMIREAVFSVQLKFMQKQAAGRRRA